MFVVPRHHSVLLVDDDPAVSIALSSSLSRRGFSVTVAATTGLARTALGLGSFESCILDLQLNGEWGLGLVPELRERHIRVVLLSGYLSIALTRHAILDLGVADVLTKPIAPDALASALLGVSVADKNLRTSPAARLTLNEVEREHIYRTLLDVNGNVSEAARQLGIHRQSLQRKLRKRFISR